MIIIYNPPPRHKLRVHFFFISKLLKLAPHLWKDITCTGFCVIPYNISTEATFILFPIPSLELFLAQHTAPSLSVAFLSLHIYSRELSDTFYIQKFDMSIPAGWQSQVFYLIITYTSVIFIIHDGDILLLNHRNQYMV